MGSLPFSFALAACLFLLFPGLFGFFLRHSFGIVITFQNGILDRQSQLPVQQGVVRSDVRACDSGRLTDEIRPQTVPSISFRPDFPFFCPPYVFVKNS